MAEREKPRGLSKNPDLGPKIKTGEVLTFSIPKESLPFYLKAGSATGFKVEQIAGEGKKFPHVNWKQRSLQPEVDNVTLPEGFIGVSIQGPKGKKGFIAFWKRLTSIERKQTSRSPM